MFRLYSGVTKNQNATLEEEYGMTIPQRFRRYARVLFAASAMILATVTAEAAVRYVTQGGAGDKDGRDWTTRTTKPPSRRRS